MTENQPALSIKLQKTELLRTRATKRKPKLKYDLSDEQKRTYKKLLEDKSEHATFLSEYFHPAEENLPVRRNLSLDTKQNWNQKDFDAHYFKKDFAKSKLKRFSLSRKSVLFKQVQE